MDSYLGLNFLYSNFSLIDNSLERFMEIKDYEDQLKENNAVRAKLHFQNTSPFSQKNIL
ncbi:MAG: hypothetical protein ACR2J3_06030 [Aridibacter sp.]